MGSGLMTQEPDFPQWPRVVHGNTSLKY